MKTALEIAQEFNTTILKGQLNPNGSAIQELAKRILLAMDDARREGYDSGYSDAEYYN